MVERDFIDSNGGYLSLGYNFEKKFGKRYFLDFYSVFCPNYEFKVKEGVKKYRLRLTCILCSCIPDRNGRNFVLGGLPWEVLEIDYNKFTIKAKKEFQIEYR